MIKGINHVGIAVKSIDETLAFLSKVAGATELIRRSFPDLGQTSCIISIGNSRYELMEPFGKGGVIHNFLNTKGEGFHHISLDSDDLDRDCALFEENGVKFVMKAKGIAFTSPKTSGGILYEITSGFET
ncbi:MAG: Glyoxalase/Bleomycin resistance protein/Dioxygenase superfamily protein [Syntrophorhabdus sp. PtaU1.Bin153]|nr:MAG: Glyoxalase/Bleomycin resistance protein/Dioxygenase superfamily protein [Syntrophorhabdus sp. PtaU1.Bin153]